MESFRSEYSRQDAIRVLAGVAMLLLPTIRANQAAGLSWEANVASVLTSPADNLQMALYQLYKLDRDPREWLADNEVRRAVGLSYEDIGSLASLLDHYKLARIRQMHERGEDLN